MIREEAIKLIVSYECKNYSEEEREQILINCWGGDESDEIFHMLPRDLQIEINNHNEPQDDIRSSRYDALISAACEISYTLYSNEQLTNLVSNFLGETIVVEGDEPVRYSCPCCKKDSLFSRGEYDICSNCGWEDDGNEQLEKYSIPNHMTLEQGRKNYYIYGTCIGKRGGNENVGESEKRY